MLECFVQKDIQKSDRKLCLQGYNLSEDQILKIAENALKRAESNYEKGLSLIVLGKINSAEHQFDRAIQHNPECSKCYVGRGNAKNLQNKFREACEDYSEAIKLDPTSALAWSNKGIALDLLGKSDDALKSFNKAQELKRKSNMIY
ncbi:MAG: tetratricopeptide repeat protein [Methanotrichaceae archaeon]